MKKERCLWAEGNELLQQYHDEEWGKPHYDDAYLFEFLILEGMQAGLNWSIVLKKREAMRKAFFQFSPDKLHKLTTTQIDKMMTNPELIRHRLKLESLQKNAIAFLNIQKEFGSFSKYIWGFTNQEIIVNHYKRGELFPTRSELSDAISKDLKKRGFKFVGTTIVYAYLEAIGIINDHEHDCDWK